MTKPLYRPTSDLPYPIKLPNGSRWPYTVFLKPVIKHPRIEIGDYTYYNDFNEPENLARTLAPYLTFASVEKLIIGKYCQIAQGTQFLTSSANHQMDGFSCYPFATFRGLWAKAYRPNYLFSGNNVVGNDVWFGHDCVVMPGVSVGTGSIVAARSVVTKNVEPYSIVGGNPARLIRSRFDQDTIQKLLAIAWWDWPDHVIDANISHIVGSNIESLAAINESLK